MNWWKRFIRRPAITRLVNWEYWSFHTVYGPIYPIWIFLGLRCRSFFFFSAANPRIENGGFLNESKKKIYDLLPEGSYPATLFFPQKTLPETVLSEVLLKQFRYPLIAKPDKGGRGRAVQKLVSPEELMVYCTEIEEDFLVQEFVPLKQEAGVFYYRYPGEAAGSISGIVYKEFLTVRGDGESTIEELLHTDPRYMLQLPVLREQLGDAIKRVPEPGEQCELVPYGNHCRGAKFTDAAEKITPELTATFNRICLEIDGFYFGRMDIRFESWEKLEKGEAFSIIELNGAGSEPTHIYDPGHSIFFAWKEIIRHWTILWRISRINHQNGVPYMSWKEALKMFKEDRQRSA